MDEKLVKHVAKAMYDTQVNEARSQASTYPLDADHIKAVLNRAEAESDRSASILIFALIEDLMLGCLQHHMNVSAKKVWTNATTGNGTLATASDRLTILILLYWIKEQTANDMKILKSIRNRFAHHADVNDFSDSKITGWISSLSNRERSISVVDLSTVKLNHRSMYFIRASNVIYSLCSDLMIGPSSRRFRVSPNDVEWRDYDMMPPNLKNVLLAVAETTIRHVPSRDKMQPA